MKKYEQFHKNYHHVKYLANIFARFSSAKITTIAVTVIQSDFKMEYLRKQKSLFVQGDRLPYISRNMYFVELCIIVSNQNVW